MRDRCCRFPGCTQSRYVDAHHIRFWSKRGKTKLSNLMLLCRAHHRLVHEGGYRVRKRRDGEIQFIRPDGRVIAQAPRTSAAPETNVVEMNRHRGVSIDHETCVTEWAGDRMNLDLGVTALLCLDGRLPGRGATSN